MKVLDFIDSLLFVVFLVFLVLKLTGVITWGWMFILLPLWPLTVIVVIVIIISCFRKDNKNYI